MYDSPIKILYGQMSTHMEGEVIKVVQSYDIQVDKGELEAALRYDRAQYEKGYRDGYTKGKEDAVAEETMGRPLLDREIIYINGNQLFRIIKGNN